MLWDFEVAIFLEIEGKLVIAFFLFISLLHHIIPRWKSIVHGRFAPH